MDRREQLVGIVPSSQRGPLAVPVVEVAELFDSVVALPAVSDDAGATCAKSGAASRHSIRLRKGSNVSMAHWTPTSLAGSRFGWITAVSTCPTTSSSRSGIGGSTPASALSRNRKRTVWRSGGIVRSRSKRSTAESFRTSKAVRAAVADFVERYNQTWRLEKLGYQTPIEAREEYELRQAA